MKDQVWQQRQFLLSSFSRQKIKLSTDVYRFIDKLIVENWCRNYMSLDEVDTFIREEFAKFSQRA